MKSLIFLVEGETESEFINRILSEYLISNGVNTRITPIMITRSGGGHGYSNIEHLKNTIKPLLYEADEPIITTMIDHYGIDSDKKIPGYSGITATDVAERIGKMERILYDEIQEIKDYRFFIPYIQKHEFETLLFANPAEGFIEDERIKDDVIDLCSKFDSIEDINCTQKGAPSKRLNKIYEEHQKKYNKVADAVDIIELAGGIDILLNKCPRFKQWIDKLMVTVINS